MAYEKKKKLTKDLTARGGAKIERPLEEKEREKCPAARVAGKEKKA